MLVFVFAWGRGRAQIRARLDRGRLGELPQPLSRPYMKELTVLGTADVALDAVREPDHRFAGEEDGESEGKEAARTRAQTEP